MFLSENLFKVLNQPADMLSKIKDNISGKITERLASDMAETRSNQDAQSKTISRLNEELISAKSDIKTLIDKQQQLINENTKALRTVKALQEQLNESINSIKVMSSTIQNHLANKITDGLNNLTQEISAKLGGSETLKTELHTTTTTVKDNLISLNQEINKLNSIASNLNAGDFELTKFSNQLKTADGEKLRLMREIDSLQRLVSSLRRRQH